MQSEFRKIRILKADIVLASCEVKIRPELMRKSGNAGCNIGLAKALREADLIHDITFIGHELNKNSFILLEQGEMDFVIGHRVRLEILQGIEFIRGFRDGVPALDQFTETLIHTKYNCLAR